MSRLIVVSNRVSLPQKSGGSVGGLAVAVGAALKNRGGLWMGWSGKLVDKEPSGVNTVEDGNITYTTIDLSRRDYEEYYNGYANRSIWPVMHYRLDLAEFDRHYFLGYQRVNYIFARRLLSLIEPDDIVWVHDYHLIPLAQELRRAGVKNKIGFFLHIPWPVKEMLTGLPENEALVMAMMAYDLVGFQTKTDTIAFMDYVVREGGGSAEPDGTLHAYGGKVKARHFPISIDTADFMKAAEDAADAEEVKRFRKSLWERKIILGVDRLDYSKGLLRRFHAYERLLQEWPNHRGDVSLVQIAPPTRSGVPQYQQIREELESEAGRVNGAYSEFDWVPIRYINKGYPRDILAGFYRVSAVGLVTPLRDGMNLVAKEYVAAQSKEDPGVLVLSRFAGAAEEMDGAMLVNPYDWEGMARALNEALEMPLEERRARWSRMREQLISHDILYWQKNFLNALEEA